MIDRRRFLVLGASLVGGLLTLELGCGGGDADRRKLAIDVSALLPPAAAQVGEARLEEDKASVAELVGVLFDGWSELDADPAVVARRLAAQVAEEHRQGRIVPVRRWRLARTEAALVTLAALEGTGAS